MAGDPYWSYVVLAMHMDDTGLTDMKGHAVTLNGNAARTDTRSKFGGYSAFFDGSGDYLGLGTSEDFSFGTGDFTIECFAYIPEYPGGGVGNDMSVFSMQASAGGYFLYLDNANGALKWFDGASGLSSPTAIPVGIWTHVAASRASGTLRLFVDGVLKATRSGYTYNIGASGVVANRVGGNWPGDGTRYMKGYLDDVRVTKGIARYTSDFTPSIGRFDGPGSVSGVVKDDAGNFVQRLVRLYRRDSGALVGEMFSDPISGAFSFSTEDYSKHYLVVSDIDSKATYLAFDGLNNSTTFVEWSGKTVTRYGDVKISTAQSKFGGASAFFDGVGDCLTLPPSSDTDFGVSDFTVEDWFSLSALPLSGAVMAIVGRYSAISNNRSWAVRIYNNAGTHQLHLVTSVNGVDVTLVGGNFSPSVGVLYHFAAVRRGSVMRLYLNGVQLGSDVTVSGALFTAQVPVSVGSWNNLTADFFNGYLDDLRISKGVARYTANFTPPAVPQVPVGNKKNALVYDSLTPV